MTFSEKLDNYKILPRLMMFVMTIVYIRCIEWALSQEELSTQMSGLISVVTGAMTGSFAIWMGAESKISTTTTKNSSKSEVVMEG